MNATPPIDELRAQWAGLLGPLPERPADARPRVLAQEFLADHVRTLVGYATEDDSRTDAFVLAPHAPPPPDGWPGVVVFHATSDNHILQPVGLADRPTRHLGIELVRMGFVVICPRNFIYGYRGLTWTDAVDELARRRPGLTGMGKMLWDGIRALDVLAGWPGVDAARIGCAGHSLGAKEALYLAAFDPRVRAAVSSEGGVGLAMSNWDAPWYWGARFRDIPPGRDHHELLAMAAPRAFLLVGGGDADGEHSRPLADAARPAFEKAGAADRLALLVHDQGHDLPDAIRARCHDWLRHHLSPG